MERAWGSHGMGVFTPQVAPTCLSPTAVVLAQGTSDVKGKQELPLVFHAWCLPSPLCILSWFGALSLVLWCWGQPQQLGLARAQPSLPPCRAQGSPSPALLLRATPVRCHEDPQHSTVGAGSGTGAGRFPSSLRAHITSSSSGGEAPLPSRPPPPCALRLLRAPPGPSHSLAIFRVALSAQLSPCRRQPHPPPRAALTPCTPAVRWGARGSGGGRSLSGVEAAAGAASGRGPFCRGRLERGRGGSRGFGGLCARSAAPRRVGGGPGAEGRVLRSHMGQGAPPRFGAVLCGAPVGSAGSAPPGGAVRCCVGAVGPRGGCLAAGMESGSEYPRCAERVRGAEISLRSPWHLLTAVGCGAGAPCAALGGEQRGFFCRMSSHPQALPMDRASSARGPQPHPAHFYLSPPARAAAP